MFRYIIGISLLLGGAPFSYAQDWQQVGNINQPVDCQYVDTASGSLYVGGPFRYFNGISVNGLFSMRNDSVFRLGSGQDFCATYNCTPIKSIIRYKDEHYVSWTNPTIGGGVQVNGIARWDGANWHSLTDRVKSCTANGFLVQDSILYVMGGLNIQSDTGRIHGIAKWDGEKWEALNFPVYEGSTPLGGCAAFYKNELYFGGGYQFGLPTGGFVLDITRFDGTKWYLVGDGIQGGVWRGVLDLVVYKGELYACGYFRQDAGNAGNKIMRWDGIKWKDVGGGICDPFATLDDMVVQDGKLYVVGLFDCVGDGIPAHGIAWWDGERWCSCGNSVFDNKITNIAFYNNDLYIGGGFTAIDGQPVKYFAKWIGDHATDTCSAAISAAPEPFSTSSPTMRLSPNPASGQVTVTLSSTSSTGLLRIVNLLGATVREVQVSGSQTRLNIADLPVGVYAVQYVSEDVVRGVER